MTELKPQSETTEVFPAPTSTPFAAEGEPEADPEDHIIDLNGAVSALFHLPNFDCAAGIHLIARIRDHADGIRRAFYHQPQPCGTDGPTENGYTDSDAPCFRDDTDAPPLDPEDLLQDHPKVSKDGNPTPDERADFVVRRLEHFIREGRVAGEGMSLRQWQDMARSEIANAVLEADLDHRHDATVSKRLLFTLGASFTTLGFWGALWAFGQIYYLISAVVCGLAGIVMLAVSAEWTVRRAYKRNTIAVRTDSIRRVESLTRRIRRMERQLKDEADRLEKEVTKAGLKPE